MSIFYEIEFAKLIIRHQWEILKRKRFVRNRNTLNTFCSIPEYVRYCTNRYHIGISEKKKAPETACFRCF